MRLYARVSRYHCLPAALAARCAAVQCSSTAAALQQSKRLAGNRSTPSRSHTVVGTRSSLHRPIPQHSTARIGPQAPMASAAADLPQEMLADLQLLQQAYEQLSFAVKPLDIAAGGSAAQRAATTSTAAPGAAAREQLVMSAPQQKRRRVSNSPSQQTADINSTQEPPVSLQDPAVSPEQLDCDTQPQLPTPAADSSPAHDASLQLATPPPKHPRTRRGRKPALQATPAATVAPVSAPSSPAGAAAVVAAAVTAAPPTELTAAPAATPAKRSRRQSAEAAPAAASTAVKQARTRKRKEATAQEESLLEQQLAASLPAADTAAVDAVLATAAAGDLDTAAAAGARGRGRGRRSTTTSSSRGRGRGRRATGAAAAGGDADAPALMSDGPGSAAAGAAADGEPAAQAKPAARRRRSSSKKTAAADSISDDADPAAAAAADKPAKPVRRTKKVIAAEVLEAASQGQFNELTSLASTYSHVALFNNSSNAAAWQQLMQQAQPQPAAAAAAAPAAVGVSDPVAPPPQQPHQQQSQQSQQQPGQEGAAVGRASSLSLCRSSGLGSFRQQVWLHSQSQSVFQAEAVATQQQDDPPATLLPASQPPAAAAATDRSAAGTGTATNGSTGSSKGVRDASEDELHAADPPAPQPLTPELQQAQLKVLPNLGYACLCMTMRQYEIFNSRDCVKKTRDAPDGLHKVSELALQNARDLVPLLHWNEAHGIRLFRLSSNIFPWMTSYSFEDLPHWHDIQQALRAAGDLAKRLGHRLTFHPSEYCKIAGERPKWVTQSVAELEVHSRIFDEMGFLPATPHNKINIHVGGTYGDKDAALERFSQVVNERLSPNCKARLTVENDDRASLYHVLDLMKVHRATGIPIVFDFHHWKFCTGQQTQEEAFRTALTTWPAGVRPVVHWSESPEDPNKMLKAHSEYIDGPINLFGLEGEVDVMIESKGKELALLQFRQYVVNRDSSAPGPRTMRAAAFAAAAAAAAAAEAEAAAAAEEDEDVEEEEGSGRAKKRKKQQPQPKRKKPTARRRAGKKKVVSESESEEAEGEEETTTDED